MAQEDSRRQEAARIRERLARLVAEAAENARTGRAGYAPACANEWKPRLCRKPKVKCGACPNQAFLPLTDEVIEGHLRGRHTVGV